MERIITRPMDSGPIGFADRMDPMDCIDRMVTKDARNLVATEPQPGVPKAISFGSSPVSNFRFELVAVEIGFIPPLESL